MITRQQIATKIIDDLKQYDFISDAWLRGSLADGTEDLLSDIDIGIEAQNISNCELADKITNYMNTSFKVRFFDWARSLLPKESIISFFLLNTPFHWHIDFNLIVEDSHQQTLLKEDVIHQFPDHYLKLWIDFSKYVARGRKDIDIRIIEFGKRVLGENYNLPKGSKDILTEVLLFLQPRSDGKYLDLFDDCRQFIKSIEQDSSVDFLGRRS